MKSDIEIAQECVMEPITKVAENFGIDVNDLEMYGKYKAKISDELFKSSKNNKDAKLVLVTAVNPTPAGEGKTTVAGNLALALAQGESKVVLVDCDMRRPSIHKTFKISNTYGISDLLVGNKKLESVAHKYNDNLTIVPSGKIPPNPAEMLGSKAMTAFLEEMKKHFDYIVLDTPPLQAVTDAQILSTKV